MDVKCLYKPCLYPLGIRSPVHQPDDSPKSLVDITAKHIVQDGGQTLKAVQVIPPELSYPLMKAALSLTRDRAIEVLLAHWPYAVLSLTKLAPPLFSQLSMRYNSGHLYEMVRRAVKLTTCLAHTFVECLKKRTPTKLQCLDLTGYPAAEVIVNYLSSHVLLVYNEQRQHEIIQTFNEMTQQLPTEEHVNFNLNQTLPNKLFTIRLDTHLETTETHMEVCRALKTGRGQACQFSFSIHSLDLNCLGVARISVLLEQIEPEFSFFIHSLDLNCLGVARISVLLEQIEPEALHGLCLQYNGINKEGLYILCPTLQHFTKLSSLDLSCNGLNFTGEPNMADRFGLTLSKLSSLSRLDLSNNRTKHKLRRLLQEIPRGLTYLRLCACGISEGDMTYLRLSHHSSSLRELDLSENQFAHERWPGIMGLLKALAGQLELFEIEDCGIEKDDFLAFIIELKTLSCLQFLNVARNESLCLMTLGDSCDMLTDLNSLEVVKASYPTDCYVSSEPELVEPVKSLFRTRLLALVNALCQKKERPTLNFYLTGP